MPDAIRVDLASLQEMAHEGIGFVGGLGSIPTHRAVVVLLVADVGDAGDFQQGLGEVTEDAGIDRAGLAFVSGHALNRPAWEHAGASRPASTPDTTPDARRDPSHA